MISQDIHGKGGCGLPCGYDCNGACFAPPADAKAALESYGSEKVREGMQRAIDRLRHEGQINPSLTYADAIEWAENILAEMEKLK